MRIRSGPEYHVRAYFRAPLDFVFRWCTDYTVHDAQLEGEHYQRRILRNTRRRVVYEDLEESPNGWNWARYTVWLGPPGDWRAERVGNYLDASLRYRLTRLANERTRLDLIWRRKPTKLAPRFSKSEIERGTELAWKRFARALESDYRKLHRRRA
jgi:hypothetical protein